MRIRRLASFLPRAGLAMKSLIELPKRLHALRTAFLLVVCGLSLGWLIGLSVSPILEVVVGGTLTLLLSIASALAGVEARAQKENASAEVAADNRDLKSTTERLFPSRYRVSVIPMACFVVGLASGAPIGVFVRTNEFLGPNPVSFAKRWSDLGLSDSEVRRRLFDVLYPSPKVEANREPATGRPGEPEKPRIGDGGSNTVENIPDVRARALTAGLFSLPAEGCGLLAGRHGSVLRARLIALGGDRIKAATDKCSSDDCLEAVRIALCK